jgi:catechol 2,3-dioxygenase
VLNSAEVEKQTAFFVDVLGFKWSDSTFLMDFVRCCSDHHSVALARGNGPSLNHMAYEMPDIDGLMRGAGRLRKSGHEILWGVGRHGPGSNVFSYFVEPNGFVTEYTTDVQQVDDTYIGHDAQWWKDLNVFPCRWNMAGVPSEFARKAMSGELVDEENERCEQVMARALGR